MMYTFPTKRELRLSSIDYLTNLSSIRVLHQGAASRPANLLPWENLPSIIASEPFRRSFLFPSRARARLVPGSGPLLAGGKAYRPAGIPHETRLSVVSGHTASARNPTANTSVSCPPRGPS